MLRISNSAMKGLLILTVPTVAVAALLVCAFDVALMTDDTAQYISVARHIVSGDGLKTNLIYLQSHFDLGGIPVSQTTWPPGFPIFIAIAATLGIPMDVAPFALSLFALIASPYIVYALCMMSGSSEWVAVVAGIAWISFVSAWTLTLGGTTELTYTFTSTYALLAAAISTRGNSKTVPWLALAGILAACAFALRYQGIFLIFALCSSYAICALTARNWQALTNLLTVAAAPTIAVVLIFGRNFFLAGSITTNSYHPVDQTLGGAIRELYWAVTGLFGVANFGVLDLLLLALVGVLAIIGVIAIAGIGQRCRTEAAKLILVTSGVYVVVTFVALFYFTLTRTAGFFNERYLLPLIPFVIVLAVAGGARLQQFSSVRVDSHVFRSVLVIALLILVSGQSRVATDAYRWHSSAHPYSEIDNALDARYGASNLRSFLSNAIDTSNPLLAPDGQHLGQILERPVVGLPAPLYTDTVWTDSRVGTIVDNYKVSYVVYFPSLFSRKSDWNRNRVFFWNLESGNVPEWLEHVYSDELIALYKVRPTRRQ